MKNNSLQFLFFVRKKINSVPRSTNFFEIYIFTKSFLARCSQCKWSQVLILLNFETEILHKDKIQFLRHGMTWQLRILERLLEKKLTMTFFVPESSEPENVKILLPNTDVGFSANGISKQPASAWAYGVKKSTESLLVMTGPSIAKKLSFSYSWLSW